MCCWETPQLGAFTSHEKILLSLLALIFYFDLMNISTCFVVKKRLELETKFEGCIQATVEYVSTIDDFDELVDPWTLARHCLGPKPSHCVLRAIRREEKSKLI